MPIDSSRLVFGPEFRTGVDIIDAQHQVLFDIINRIDYLLLVNVADMQVINQAIEDLVNYALYHFSIEERRVSLWVDRAQLGDHVLEHNEFRRRTNDFRSATNGRKLSAEVLELQTYLKHWLVDHILHKDVPLFRQIEQQSPVAPRQHVINGKTEVVSTGEKD